MGVALFFALVAVGSTGASYDQAAHQLEARGAAAADLRAPTAAIARVKAERTARARAEKKLTAALVELCPKGKSSCSDVDALAKLLEQATLSDERYGSDGSVELRLTLSTKELDLK